MRTHLTVPAACVALFLTCPHPAFAQSTPPDRAADAAAIRAHIESICQAFVDKDSKKLRRRTVRTGAALRRGPATSFADSTAT